MWNIAIIFLYFNSFDNTKNELQKRLAIFFGISINNTKDIF